MSGTYFKMQTALEYRLALSCLGCRYPYVLPLALQGSANSQVPGLVNFVTAVAYHLSINLPKKFSRSGTCILADPCRNTSPAAYDATLLQKEMLSRSYLSLSFALRTRVKSFLLPGPKAQRLVSTTKKKTEMEEGDDAASCKIFPHLGFHFQSEGERDCDVRVE